MPKKMPAISHDAHVVWAAASYAQRINQGYVKSLDDTDKVSNRTIIESVLSDISVLTSQDYDMGEQVRRRYNSLTFEILSGNQLNSFENNALLIAQKDVITSYYDIAVIASLPSCYERDLKRREIFDRIRNAKGEYLGKIGERVNIVVRVLYSTHSRWYNTNWVKAITVNNQACEFNYPHHLRTDSEISIVGRVKSYRENFTKLTHVKVIDEIK